jgi:sirohydrochlorin cobaltochelatase
VIVPLCRPLAALAALAGLALHPSLVGAQTTRPVGTVVVAHGGGPEWNAQVVEIARAVRTGGPVEVSFLMGPGAKTTRFQDVVRKLEEHGVSEIVVVPLLVSSHSGHYDQIRWLAGDSVTLGETMRHHLHMAGIERASTKLPMRVTRAIDDSPEVARVLAERALAITPRPAGRALFIVGHGPNSAEDYAAWMGNLRPIADSVRAMTGFRDVRVGLVRDDAPAAVRAEAVRGVRELIELQFLATGDTVTVVPALVSRGTVSREKIPADLAGLPMKYVGEALLPHPGLARWVEARVAERGGGATAQAPTSADASSSHRH